MKVTTRLSKPNVSVSQLLRVGHSLTGPLADWNGITGSELYFGTSYAGVPSWVNFLLSATNAPTALPRLYNEGATALLFIPVTNRYMIFCFGYSNQHLSAFGLERDFGLKVVLNTVNPSKLKSIDSKKIGPIIINQRTQLSKENRIEDFGFEINKDFLRHVAGKPAAGNFATAIAGSDSLNINCDLTASSIQQKVTDIYNFYSATNYQTHYSWIDNIRNIKDRFLLPQLETDLLASFNNLLTGSASNLYISCPEIIDYTAFDHFRISGYRSNAPFYCLEIDDVIKDLLSKNINTITGVNLDAFQIQAVDGNENALKRWTLKDWIVYETVISGVQYIFTEGEWYEVSNNYYNIINTSYNGIVSNPAEFAVLSPTKHKNEVDYIKNYSFRRGHEKIFDKSLSYAYGPQNSIEICDIYNSSREFIHVKEGGASSKLSHLFNQGFVSASLLLNDVNFRTDLTTKLAGHTTLLRTINSPVNAARYTVVYRILKSGASLTIPFFSKIVLIDTHKKIKTMSYQFRLEWVQKI